MKKFSRILSLLLALVVALGLMSITGFAAQEEVVVSDLVSDTVTAKGGVISKEMADFQFLTGNFFEGGALTPFTVFSGNGQYTPSDVVGDMNGNNAVWRWQWRAVGSYATVLKITAKENMQFKVEQRENPEEQWATHSAYAYVTEDADGNRLVHGEMKVKSTMNMADYTQEIHLAKGDTLYVVYYVPSGDSSVVTSGYFPFYVMSSAAYDESKRADYSVITALKDAKEEKTGALQQKYTEMIGDGNVYSDRNTSKLEEIVQDAVSQINKKNTVDEVNAAYEAAVAEMNDVPTVEKENESVNAFRQQAKDELAGLVSKEDYSSDNWKTIQERIAKANADLDAATTSAQISSVLAYAKADLRKIEKKEPMNPIVLIVAAAAAVVVAAVVVAIVVLKNKKKD